MDKVLAQTLKMAIAAVVGLAVIVIVIKLNIFGQIESETAAKMGTPDYSNLHSSIVDKQNELSDPEKWSEWLGFKYNYELNSDGETYTLIMTGKQSESLSVSNSGYDNSLIELLNSPFCSEAFFNNGIDYLENDGVEYSGTRHTEIVTDIKLQDAKITNGTLLFAGTEAETVTFQNVSVSASTFQDMFDGSYCKIVDFGDTDLSQIHSFNGAFEDCSCLKTVKMPAITSHTTNIANMFDGDLALEEIEGIEDWDVSNLVDAEAMFHNCLSLKTLDLSKWKPSKLRTIALMFGNCISLSELNLEGWELASLKSMNGTFQGCCSLVTLTIETWSTPSLMYMWGTFDGCSSVTTLDLDNWDTSNLQYMDYAFYDMSLLTTLKIDTWDTSSLYSMKSAFSGCKMLTSLNLSGWDAPLLEYIAGAFYDCNSLTTIGNISFDLANVEDISYMFYNCYSLEEINVSDWDTSNIEKMQYAFCYCRSLQDLDVSNFNVSRVRNMSYMFYGCESLRLLDLSSWEKKTNCNDTDMFLLCNATIIQPNVD